MLKHFWSSLIFTIICLWLSWFVWGAQALFITIMLAVLEISLSFDNAIINAKEIEKMDKKRKRRFLTWWMIIAVFGMRILFPLIIVSVIWHVSLRQALMIALNDPAHYQALITASHIPLAWFWWTFLLMVFLAFFFDEAKEIHRIKVIEKQLSRLGKLDTIEIMIALTLMIITTKLPWFPEHEIPSFLVASIAWLITYLIVSSLSAFLQEQEKTATKTWWLAGWFGTFMYLEILDASFSFDGVIGAFALTKNIIIIALWLGIGAMFVRSMTLMLVEKKTLSHYRYLEHWAFWAIGALAIIMLLSTIYHIPEIFTWLISGILIAIAIGHSIYSHRSGKHSS